MENSLSISVTPLQILLSLLFQAWIIIFPILIIRKLNHITTLLEDQLEEEGE